MATTMTAEQFKAMEQKVAELEARNKALEGKLAAAGESFTPHMTVDEKGMLTLHFSGNPRSASNPYMSPDVLLRAEKQIGEWIAWVKANKGKTVKTVTRKQVGEKWYDVEGTVVLGTTAPAPKRAAANGTVVGSKKAGLKAMLAEILGEE